MKFTRNIGNAGILLVVGSITAALSKWYLVWWAQKIGGAELLGMYSLLLAFGTPLFVISQLGLRTLFLTKLTAYPWRTYVILRVLGLTLGTFLFIGISITATSTGIVLILCVLGFKIFDSIVDLDLARIQFNGSLIQVGAITTLGGVFSFVFATIGYFLFHSFSGVVFGSAFGSFLISIYAMVQSRKITYTPTTTESGYRDLLSSSFPVTSAQLLGSLVMYLPILLLSIFSTPTVVGVYSGIAYILTAASLLGSSISKLLITPLRNLRARSGDQAVFQKTKILSAYAALFSLIFAIVLVLIGADLFSWIYGPEFRPTATQLGILSLAAILIIISLIYSTGLTVVNRYHAVNWAFTLACIATGVSGLILFPLGGFQHLTTATIMAFAGSLLRALAMVAQSRKISLH